MSAPAATDPTLERLEDQIAWYDRKSGSNQQRYKWLKVVTLVSAALIPAMSTTSAIPHGALVAAARGVLIVVVEGLQQLNQYQANWIAYRSTCESLRHEKYLYLANAGPYAATERPLALLAERIEGLVSQEHAKWVSGQEEAANKRTGASR